MKVSSIAMECKRPGPCVYDVLAESNQQLYLEGSVTVLMKSFLQDEVAALCLFV